MSFGFCLHQNFDVRLVHVQQDVFFFQNRYIGECRQVGTNHHPSSLVVLLCPLGFSSRPGSGSTKRSAEGRKSWIRTWSELCWSSVAL